MENMNLVIKTDVKNITICTKFKRLENTDKSFKRVIAVLEVEVENEKLDVEVYWDSFESRYSLNSDCNRSYDRLLEALLSCFSEEQLTDKDGYCTELYDDLVNEQMDEISDSICDFAEKQIYAEI